MTIKKGFGMENIASIILASGIGAAVGSFIFRLIEKYFGESIKDKFKNKQEKRKEKTRLIKKAIKVLTEGEVSGWKMMPSNHVENVKLGSEIEIVLDEELGKDLIQLSNCWALKSAREKLPPTKENIKFSISLGKELDTLDKRITKRIKKLKK